MLLRLFCLAAVTASDATAKAADATASKLPDLPEEKGEKFGFQAEVSRLMDIIIHNLYTDKQVFLRELVSNAADALEKARFHSVEDPNYLSAKPELEIKIEHDAEAKTLSITDTGIGMTKQDLINNLGTVAKSGTTNFIEAMANGGDANLIGQFGVGFYSAFLVADKVAVHSKHNDDKQHVWVSAADGSFTVFEDPEGDSLGRGSRIVLYMKEDSHEFLNEETYKKQITKYSNFVTHPIYCKSKKEVESDDDDDDDVVKDKDEDEDEEDKEEKKPKEKEYVYEWEQVNTQKPIWVRAKEDITEDEYKEFYKSIAKDTKDPIAYTHFSAEGEIEFRSILYIPAKAPPEMFQNYYQTKTEVKLFVRRVLVADKFDDLLPRYLNFIRGIVDSDDLPLNVSREQLQQSKIMKVITKKIVRKVLELIRGMTKKDKEDEDDKKDEEKKDDDDDDEEETGKFADFYKEYSKNLKLGCQEDDSNRSKISKLLRFTNSKKKQISLDSYISKLTEKQENIFYMSGEDFDVMSASPNLQIFKKKKIDVLMLTDPLDEGCIQRLGDFEGKKFVSIQKADLKLDETDDEAKRFKKLVEMYKPLTKWWKTTLEKQIGDVEISKRLTDAPLTVVSSKYGYSAYQERLMKAQAFHQQQEHMAGKKTIEINPNHPIIVDLLQKVKDDEKDVKAIEVAEMLFQVAMVEQGFDLSDPNKLSTSVYGLMSQQLGVDPNAPVKEIEVPEDEETEDTDDKDDKEDAEKKEEL